MHRHAFTLPALLLTLLAWTSVAQADRVVLLPPSGTAQQEKLDDVEEALGDAIRAVGHEAVTERRACETDRQAVPETAAEMAAIARLQNAEWVVVPRVVALPGQYRLTLRVGYAPLTRAEELVVNVEEAREAERLEDVLGAMLRPEGLGDDALRLTEPEEDATGEPPPEDTEPTEDREPTEEEPPPEEPDGVEQAAEEEAREAFLERERQREAERLAAEREAWENRERYGEVGGPWLLSGGIDIRPIVASSSIVVDGVERGGGVLGGLSLRLGRRIDALPGLEVRGAFDLFTGASSGFGLAGGAVYLHSFWDEAPVFLGGGLETGLFQFVTGNRVPSLVIRGSGVASWRPTDALYVEAALPELMVLTGNGGVVTLGVSVRAGTRF